MKQVEQLVNEQLTAGDRELLFLRPIAEGCRPITLREAAVLIENPSQYIQDREEGYAILDEYKSGSDQRIRHAGARGIVLPTKKEHDILKSRGMVLSDEQVVMPFYIRISLPSLAARAIARVSKKEPNGTYSRTWYWPTSAVSLPSQGASNLHIAA